MGLPPSTMEGDGADLDSAAARISEARISPPAPEPRTSARFTPRSLARRRALGEILTAWFADCGEDCVRVAGCFADAAVDIAEAAGTAVVFLPDSTATSSAGGTSPGRTIPAMVLPTRT